MLADAFFPSLPELLVHYACVVGSEGVKLRPFLSAVYFTWGIKKLYRTIIPPFLPHFRPRSQEI